jgi:hypothetical protein
MIETFFTRHGFKTMRVAGRLLVYRGNWQLAPTSEVLALKMIGYWI